ncbi:hypothetical protein EX30DRAFT_197371 [Ascodesmis nigricans]|uniref:Uncharacterized protein n=1 Tax=Ascodesmis nigricans TaxID=341454 RepID=A0A4S2MKW2_9PEZI|nr:hypothetical protein EX30DRAFT_197371 [Ascodesmis nigricans]
MQCDDDTMPATSAYHAYMGALQLLYQKIGINSSLHATDYQRLLELTGFVDVVIWAFKVPIGGWPRTKRLRRTDLICADIASTGADALAFSMLTNVGGYSVKAARKIVDDVVATFRKGEERVLYGVLCYGEETGVLGWACEGRRRGVRGEERWDGPGRRVRLRVLMVFFSDEFGKLISVSIVFLSVSLLEECEIALAEVL